MRRKLYGFRMSSRRRIFGTALTRCLGLLVQWVRGSLHGIWTLLVVWMFCSSGQYNGWNAYSGPGLPLGRQIGTVLES